MKRKKKKAKPENKSKETIKDETEDNCNKVDAKNHNKEEHIKNGNRKIINHYKII